MMDDEQEALRNDGDGDTTLAKCTCDLYRALAR